MSDHTSYGNGTLGTIVTLIFLWIGIFDLNKWAVIIAMLAGLTTIIRNVLDMREKRRTKKNLKS